MDRDLMQQECEQIGARIRNVRMEKNMSQADLAAKANLSLPHISSIELGKTNMRLSTFIQLIEALQVSADSIIRANVPSVTHEIYPIEITKLFEDCTPTEQETLKEIIGIVRKFMRNKEDNQ